MALQMINTSTAITSGINYQHVYPSHDTFPSGKFGSEDSSLQLPKILRKSATSDLDNDIQRRVRSPSKSETDSEDTSQEDIIDMDQFNTTLPYSICRNFPNDSFPLCDDAAQEEEETEVSDQFFFFLLTLFSGTIN